MHHVKAKPPEKPVLGFSRLASQSDVQCVMMGRLGFSYRHIMKMTGLNKDQIHYRLKLMNANPTDYRDGESDMAKQMTKMCNLTTSEIAARIRQQLLLDDRPRNQ